MQDVEWFKQFATSKEYEYMKNHPIVYFCAEYALDDTIPIYAGGLGVLAGDFIREAVDQQIPLVAVGLYYHEGYLSHDLYKEGIMMKVSSRVNPESIKLSPVIDAQGKRIVVSVPIQNTQVYLQAWILEMGTVRLYLLDTNIKQNEEGDRRITDRLYTSSKEMRFKQEMILGLGGLRLLEAIHINPIGYHLNEGHSALLALEIARYEMQKHKRSFKEELSNTKEHIFFTNHTLVAAGQDVFNADLASTLLSGFATELQVPATEIVKLGLVADSSIFSMTLLALRMANKINAVSKLHAKKAAEIWGDHPMIPITNGVHIKTWDYIGSGDIWEKHMANKKALLETIQEETGLIWGEDTLLLGWARRIVGYKRPLALFDNLEEFRKIANSSDRPVRVVISGLSHESDEEGLVILEKIQKIVNDDLRGLVVYLPGYRMTRAKQLVSGCDVWLNTPVVGFEACGTSGMKASLNGVLPCSTPDGWVAEAELYKVGWLLQDENLPGNILAILKEHIVPVYYDKDKHGVSQNWVTMMKNARDMIMKQFSTTSMLRRYIEEFYLPIIKSHEARLH